MKKYWAHCWGLSGGEYYQSEAKSKKAFTEAAKRFAQERDWRVSYVGEGEPPNKDREILIHNI